MPWKLVSFLFLLILATLFIGFNLENRCDVSFIFYTFKDVPIFVSLLFSYAVGALTVIPFFWAHGIRKNRRSASGGYKNPYRSDRPRLRHRLNEADENPIIPEHCTVLHSSTVRFRPSGCPFPGRSDSFGILCPRRSGGRHGISDEGRCRPAAG